MKENDFYNYVDLLERVLSFSYKERFTFDFVEKTISRSSFFKSIEKQDILPPQFLSDAQLLKTLFPFEKELKYNVPVYNQCLWASESYMWIQKKTKLTFEAIFIFVPLKEMYSKFDLYHEMDFSQIVDYFNEKRKKTSVVDLLFKKFKYSVKEVAEKTGIPYNTLVSLKNKRRSISGFNVKSLNSLANVFHVRIETIAELEVEG